MTDYSTDAQAVASAMNAVYENKQTNKKNSLDGDYSSDNASYPTCKAVNSALSGKLDKTHTSYKGKNVVVDSTSGDITFEDKPTIPTKTSDLTNDGDGTNAFVKTNDSRLTDSRTPTSHQHGYLTNDGKVGSSSGKIITTGTGGVIQASDSITKSMISDFPSIPTKTSDLTNDADGTTGVTYVKSNDSRLTDSRTPTSHTHGNISNVGAIGNDSGKIITTGNNGVLQASSNLSTGDIKDSTAHSHIGSSANATQSTINGAIDGMLNLNVVKQSTAETGYASTYYITQNGSQIGAKINIEKDKMLRSISIETVGSTPTQEEIDAGMTTGDKYLLFIVNTVDNQGTTRLLLPLTDVFDLQTADNVTLQLSSGGVYSIKNAGVDTAQLKNGAVTSDKIASAVKNSWLSETDVENKISAFATALANAINPSS